MVKAGGSSFKEGRLTEGPGTWSLFTLLVDETQTSADIRMGRRRTVGLG